MFPMMHFELELPVENREMIYSADNSAACHALLAIKLIYET